MSLKFLFILLSCISLHGQTPFTILIDPAGDAQHTGREIGDTFERGITLQCAQELKKQLTENNPNIRVILTRVPGETIQPLHNALFSNRLQANLYLRIGFYYEQNIPSHVSIFYYCENTTDYWHKYNPLRFYPLEQAYLINLNTTKELGTTFLQIFNNNKINSVFVPYGLFGIPLQPLIGIQAPALYIEAGLYNTNDWRHLIKPLISCIQAITT